jgi:predicted  nucleic acid-binding Zn-ribbon protein
VSAAAAAEGAGSAGLQSTAELREAKKDLNRIERQLSRLSDQEDKIHVEMAAKAADHRAVLALNDTLRAIVDERETLEREWLAVAEIIG